MGKVSQKDIALALNLSRVTITKALQDHPDIALKTRKLVKDKAAELGYVPNFIGRSLSSSKSYSIGICLPKIAHSFFSHSVEYMYEAANKLGYQIIPAISFESGLNEKKNLESLLSMGCEGIIIDTASGVTDFEMYDFLKRAEIQTVFYDRFPSNYEGYGVCGNDLQGAESLTRFVISKGYKKIICMAGPKSISVGRDRLQGFLNAHESTGHELNPSDIIEVDMTEKDGYDKFIGYFISNGTPDAVVCVNDSVALGVYKAAAKVGISIPKDVAVVGYGNLNSGQLITPALTTCNIPVQKMCNATVDLLVKLINNTPVADKVIQFDDEIVIRDSV
ncbi:MAG: LacI family DNA-binding transcriptional regulator [Prolixibacteraceae bacterium]|nr:LacI family DNA-binding transcriptional regulator [Prolixibacteraceae bacterium]